MACTVGPAQQLALSMLCSSWQGQCVYIQGVHRLSHIQYWELELNSDNNLKAIEVFIRKLVCLTRAESKKIEIYAHEKNTQKLLESLGFHCRGKKIASCIISNNYYDEIGLDLSFFDIQDAKKLLGIYLKDGYQIKKILFVLSQCYDGISHALSKGQIDRYAALYLENMAFQMIRESIGELTIRRYGQQNQEPQPWESIIEQLPDTLRVYFLDLDDLTTKTTCHEALVRNYKPFDS